MSADEDNPAATAGDAPISDAQSNKRKAAVDGDAENDADTSPKRLKLDKDASNTKPILLDDHRVPESELSTEPEARVEDDKIDTPGEPQQETKNPSRPQSRDASEPKRSRSPTLSHRTSIPTPEPKKSGGAPEMGLTDRRRNFSNEEKKRGQRLFGGLLSTLSQKTPNSQQKKRLEIERRQLERAQQQRAEDDRRRAEKLAKLNHVRKIEQVGFDERVMKTRHASMLAQAHSLSTRSEPKLFYLPWKLTPTQEDEIKEQIRATKETIERETSQFRRQKEERLRDLGVITTLSEPEEDRPREDANSPHRDDGHPQSRRPRSSSAKHESDGRGNHENHHDDAGYVMVENEEDTVIY